MSLLDYRNATTEPTERIECIGDGHHGCGWRGGEQDAKEYACRYTWMDGVGITGYVLDLDGEETVWICPACGGECAHTSYDD